ncbi:hypothetical protein SVIOM342S_03844 [Streptomyces violaceorubidus]
MEVGRAHREPRCPGDTELRLDGYLLRGRATPTARQLEEVGVRADALREVTAVEFLRAMAGARGEESYDVLVLALVGGGVQAMLHGLGRVWEDGAERPVVVTGYVGVVYEKLADGLLLRHGADLVLANSRQDADRFRAVYEGVGADAAAVTEAAKEHRARTRALRRQRRQLPPVLRPRRLAVAVVSAHDAVRGAARAVTTVPGGEGAVREIATWLLGPSLDTPDPLETPTLTQST